MKIGIVDLDTSHPESWLPLLRALGQEVVAVHDGGTVRPEGFAGQFAQEWNIPVVCRDLSEMVPLVDGVILHGCNWDQHLAKAEPFLAAKRAVFIDKPIAGNVADLLALISWEEDRGARIVGGSALRYAAEARAFLDRAVEERGVPQTIFTGCAVDDFNYGIHAYSLACALMGPGLLGARYLRGETQDRIELVWPEERAAYLAVGKLEAWLPCYATIVTERTVTPFVVDSSKLYQDLLTAVLPSFSGAADPTLSLRTLVEPEFGALAALRSRVEGGAFVALAELDSRDPGYDGAAFAADYRRRSRA